MEMQVFLFYPRPSDLSLSRPSASEPLPGRDLHRSGSPARPARPPHATSTPALCGDPTALSLMSTGRAGGKGCASLFATSTSLLMISGHTSPSLPPETFPELFYKRGWGNLLMREVIVTFGHQRLIYHG